MMQKISIDKVKKIAKQYKLKPCKVSKTGVVNIRKHKSPNIEDISWEEFETTLKKRRLVVYKAVNSDFLKIMKDKR